MFRDLGLGSHHKLECRGEKEQMFLGPCSALGTGYSISHCGSPSQSRCERLSPSQRKGGRAERLAPHKASQLLSGHVDITQRAV